jgi:hypothetical protein
MTNFDSVSSALRLAHEAVDAAEVPEDLRVAAFEKAAAVLLPSAAAAPPAQARVATPSASPSSGEASAAERAAKKLHVEERQLDRVLEFDPDGVHLLVQRSKLPRAKSEAIQQVALLVVAGRQAAGMDPEGWTHQSHVRDATEALGVDDRKNFATHLKRVDGLRNRGSGKTGELKANAVGFEAAARLIQQISAESEVR